MNGYELSRVWFDWCFENPEKVKPNHTALYFFCIEHCNRLGWKSKFGLPTTMAKEAIGMKSYNTYINTLNDLVDWGFIKMIERSKNQYSSNIIALSNFDKARDKALDKALIKHVTKQSESTRQSIDSINKQVTKEPLNKEPISVSIVNPKHKLSIWIDENAPTVNKLKEPFTYEQCEKLIEDYDKEYIREILKAMHNYEPLLKKNRSANLTFRNWSTRNNSYETWMQEKGRVKIKMNT